MRTKKEEPSKKEVDFKYSKKIENIERKSSNNFDNDPMKKIMFPFNCFNHDQIGHFATKCSYENIGSRNDSEQAYNEFISNNDERKIIPMTMETKLDNIKK